MNRKIINNVQEAVEYLFSKEIEGDIIDLPPEVDELTDEEEIYDNKLDAPVIKDIAGKVEVISTDDEFEKMNMSSTLEKKDKNLKPEKIEIVWKTKENTEIYKVVRRKGKL